MSVEVVPGGHRRIDRVLDPGFTEEVERLGLPELRARREEAEAEEADVSYLRRLLQGRLDILRAELVRGSSGGEQDVAGLLAGLPAILTDDAPGTFSAIPRILVPSRADQHRRRVERLVSDDVMDELHRQLFKSILDEWRTIRGVDRKTDELLWKRFSKAREGFNRRRGSHFADLDRQRASSKTRKEELTAEAEKLAESEDWGPTTARFRDLMAEWKAAGRAQKDTDDAIWQRFRGAQDAFFARRSASFSERDAEFVANAAAKKALAAWH